MTVIFRRTSKDLVGQCSKARKGLSQAGPIHGRGLRASLTSSGWWCTHPKKMLFTWVHDGTYMYTNTYTYIRMYYYYIYIHIIICVINIIFIISIIIIIITIIIIMFIGIYIDVTCNMSIHTDTVYCISVYYIYNILQYVYLCISCVCVFSWFITVLKCGLISYYVQIESHQMFKSCSRF